MNRTHRKILTSATAAAILALAGCSSQESDAPVDGPNHGGSPAHGGNTDQVPTFDFSMPKLGPVTVHEMRFEIPQVVLENEPDYVENKMFNTISIKPMQIETPGVCGLEITYELHNDPVERLAQQYLANDDPSVPNYVYRPEREKNLTPEQAYAMAEDAVAGSSRKPESALDLTNPKPGRYVSDDFTKAKVIGSCASSNSALQTLAMVSYREVQTDPTLLGGAYVPFAEAEVGVFTNGDVFVTSTDIKGWEQDSNGDWIPN